MIEGYEIFLSYTGEIIIKNNNSLLIYKIDQYGIIQAFANDNELHQMILFPIERIPRRIWKRHSHQLKKIFSEA